MLIFFFTFRFTCTETNSSTNANISSCQNTLQYQLFINITFNCPAVSLSGSLETRPKVACHYFLRNLKTEVANSQCTAVHCHERDPKDFSRLLTKEIVNSSSSSNLFQATRPMYKIQNKNTKIRNIHRKVKLFGMSSFKRFETNSSSNLKVKRSAKMSSMFCEHGMQTSHVKATDFTSLIGN